MTTMTAAPIVLLLVLLSLPGGMGWAALVHQRQSAIGCIHGSLRQNVLSSEAFSRRRIRSSVSLSSLLLGSFQKDQDTPRPQDVRRQPNATTTVTLSNTAATTTATSEPSTKRPSDDTASSPSIPTEPEKAESIPRRQTNVLNQWLQDVTGLEPTADLYAIGTIYFVQGALGLAALAKTYLLKDELHLGPAELSALTGLFVLPWTIKPVYGFLSDGFPLFGYRRKSYLMAAGLIGAVSYGVLGVSSFWPSGSEWALGGTIAALLLSSACIAFSDVVADGIVVTKTRQAAGAGGTAGGLQSLCWGASATGSLLSAYFSGSLLEWLPVRSLFGLASVLPLLVALTAWRLPEERVTSATVAATTGTAAALTLNGDQPVVSEDNTPAVMDKIQEQVLQLKEAFAQPSIWKPALFLFLWQSTPTADGAFFFFLTNDLGLGPEFMGRVRLVTSVATLAGVALYNSYLKTVPIKSILTWSAWASFPLGLVPLLLTTHLNRELGIPDQALIYGDDVVLAVLGEIAFLPCLVLAARVCPVGLEAVLFATLMSLFNGASTVGTELGAALTKVVGITESNFDNLSWLLLFCNVTSLYPLLFMGFLDQIGDFSEQELEDQQEAQPQELKKYGDEP